MLVAIQTESVEFNDIGGNKEVAKKSASGQRVSLLSVKLLAASEIASARSATSKCWEPLAGHRRPAMGWLLSMR